VGVNEVGVPRRPAGGACEGGQKGRQQQRPPGLAAEVAHDAGAVGNSVVAEGGGRDDLDIDAVLAQAQDRVPHEGAGNVAVVAGVGGRQADDAHAGMLPEKGYGVGRWRPLR
jgi:hypothetical protein